MNFIFRQVASSDVPMELHQALDVSSLVKGRKDITGIGSLQADLQVKPAEGGIVDVSGTLSVELDMSCSRCLKPLKRKVDIEFEESFKHSDNPEANLQNEEEELRYVTEDRVDLTPYIEESFLLNLPFVTVCKDSCKGLCPNCGIDLNERECDCNKDRIDPRLAALSDFFKQ